MSYKCRTNKVLGDCYSTYGLRKTIDVAYAMLDSAAYDNSDSFRSVMHGEVCESVLELCIKDWFKSHKTSVVCKKGLIVGSETNKEFLTEIDLVLATRHQLALFECKSYRGDKTLVGKGIIQRDKCEPFDVYAQHINHFKALYEYVKGCRVNIVKTADCNPVTIAMFNFSHGELRDLRSGVCRKRMPCFGVDTINGFLDQMCRGPALWDIRSVRSVLDELELEGDRKREEHLDYVKGLRERR